MAYRLKKGAGQPAPFRLRSQKYLNHVRGRKCLIDDCYNEASAHHLTFIQPSAKGLKAGDQYTVPLCHTHHMDLHQSGLSEKVWWALQGIDPEEWAKKTYEEWCDG